MKEQITIKVQRESNNPQKPFITLYEHIVDSDASISVPYQTLVDSFRFIYGNGVIISVCSGLI